MLSREVPVGLDEVGLIARGKSKHRPRDDSSLYGGTYPFVQTGDVKHAALYLNEYSQTYNEKGLSQSKLWPPGTLCITIAANIAETAILGMSACFPDNIIGFVPKKNQADVRFIKYCLDTYKLQIQSISHGTTQDNLSLEKLRSVKFRVPDIEAQRKIAAILTAYDDLIENNKRRIALLEKMAEEIYREWFVRLRFPGHESYGLRAIPSAWGPYPSDQLLDVLSGGTPKTDDPSFWDGPIPFFTPRDAGDALFVFDAEKSITEKGLENCNSPLYPVNTIFITARGTVGKVALAASPMAMNQSCYALRPKSGRDPYFHFFSIRNAIAHIKGISKSGVFSNIVVDTFKNVPLLRPDEETLDQFAAIVGPKMELMKNLAAQNRMLVRTRDLLLGRLISGKLRVDQFDIQFPPSMREST